MLRFVLLLTLLMLSGCQPNKANKDRPPAVTIEAMSHLTIGNDEAAPSTSLFGRIEGIAADSTGNIYVADYSSASVKVFAPNGRFLRAIGGRGRGPGEFQKIRALTITSHNELIVVDGGLFRSTRLSLDGDVLDVSQFEQGISPYSLHHWGRDEYLVHDLSVNRFMEGKKEIFHLFDDHLQRHIHSFGTLSAVGQNSPWAPVLLSFQAGSTVRLSPNRFLFAPWTYAGTLYEFVRDGSAWHRSNEWQGVSHHSPFERLDPTPPQQSAAYTIWTSTPIRSGEREEVAFVIHNESSGLFRLTDGRILHFTTLRRGEEPIFGAEVFDTTGTLLGYGPIQGDLPHPKRRGETSEAWTLPAKIWSKGPNDCFYIEDRSSGFPVVRVVSIHVKHGSNESPSAPAACTAS